MKSWCKWNSGLSVKRSFYFLLVLILAGCKSTSDKDASGSIQKIILDSSQSKWGYDISPLLEQNIEVIKLETASDCLLRADGNAFFTEDRIFISDKTLKKVFMFDWNGKYLKSFGVVGRGPGEYIDLGDYFVKGDSLYIQDKQQDKIVVFPLDGGKQHEFYLDPPIYFNEFFELDDRFYFVTGYSNDYNLIRLNPTDGSRKYYLPYEPGIDQKNQQWKLNKYISKYRDTVYLIYPRIDTIYKVFSNTVCPEYAVNFVHNKIPESLLNQTGTEILKTSIDQGYIVGLEKVCVSRDYIFGYFGEGKKIQEFIYFKAKEESVIAESLLLKNWGNLRALNYTVTDQDDFIFMYDALSLKEAWQYIVSRNPFLKEEDREKLRSVTESLQDEDNPVLFKCKLKKI